MPDPQALLRLMLEDLEKADPLYRPTNFWESGLPAIAAELERHGFESFRRHPSAAFWYVPLYRSPFFQRHPGLCAAATRLADLVSGPRRIGARLKRVLDGESRFRRDYAVFLAAQDGREPRLAAISESTVGEPLEQFEADGRRYSRSLLNYLRGLSLLARHADLSRLERALEIGGGYGTLGEILLGLRPKGLYVDVDIPPVAAVASYYLTELFGEEAVLTYERSRGLATIDLDELAGRFRAIVLCPWQLPRVRGEVDLFVNFMSFQEMEPDVVANYARLVSPLTRRWVLMRNSRRGKTVVAEPGEIGVLRATTSQDLIGSFGDFTLVARDAEVFGDLSWDGEFASEVLCLEKGGHNTQFEP